MDRSAVPRRVGELDRRFFTSRRAAPCSLQPRVQRVASQSLTGSGPDDHHRRARAVVDPPARPEKRKSLPMPDRIFQQGEDVRRRPRREGVASIGMAWPRLDGGQHLAPAPSRWATPAGICATCSQIGAAPPTSRCRRWDQRQARTGARTSPRTARSPGSRTPAPASFAFGNRSRADAVDQRDQDRRERQHHVANAHMKPSIDPPTQAGNGPKTHAHQNRQHHRRRATSSGCVRRTSTPRDVAALVVGAMIGRRPLASQAGGRLSQLSDARSNGSMRRHVGAKAAPERPLCAATASQCRQTIAPP